MNAKKYFLPLLSILLLASCNGTTDSTTEKPNDSLSNVLPSPSLSESKPSTQPEKSEEEYFSDYLSSLKKGFSFEGKNYYKTSTGYSNYCLDVKVKDDGYEFVRYDSKQDEEPNRDSVMVSYFYTYDKDLQIPYVCEPILDINNAIDYEPAPIGDDGDIVKWADSSYVNLFQSLTKDDFYLEDETFSLDTSKSSVQALLPKFAEQFYPKNPGFTVKSLSFVFNQETKEFTFQRKFNPYGFFSQQIQTISGQRTAGDAFSFDREVKVLEGEEKAELKAAFDKLKTYKYSFEDIIYTPSSDASSLVQDSKNEGKTDGKSLIVNTESDGIENNFLYQAKENNRIQQAVKLNGNYYAYHDPVSARVASLLPSFDRSTLFFDKKEGEENTYVYNKKARFSKTKTYNRDGEGRIVSERTIHLLANGVKFNINFEYPQSTEEITYLYSDEDDITKTIEVKEDCSELKTSDLVAGYKENLKNVIALLGSKENLDLIPVLGGKESICGLYYSDGVDSEGEVTKERYYGFEYRLTKGTELAQTQALETKLEAAGFAHSATVGTIFGGDYYTKTIQVGEENKTMGLEIGYSTLYSTLAIALTCH